MKTKIIPFLSLFLLLLAVVAPVGTARANSADQKIRLVAAPGSKVKGTAKFRNRGHEQELQVEVEMSRRSAGMALTIIVDDVAIGTIKLDKTGSGELSLNSQHGDAVPPINAGSTIAIVNGGGELILGGQF